MVDGIEVARRTPFGNNPVVGPRGTKTQRSILTAALAVFGEHGYHDSRIEQITEATGCSRPTFYQYFSSKEDVFRALASYVAGEVVAMTEHLGPVTPDAEGWAALAVWMRELADFYDEYAPVFTGFSEAARDDRGLAGASAKVSAEFGKALRPHLAIDGRAVKRDVMASIVVTMIVRANLLRRGSAGLVARKRFVDSLAALVHRVLVGPTVASIGNGGQGGKVPTPRTPARLRATMPKLAVGPPSTRPLSPQGLQMRARIVDAGIAVFPRRGFHETRVDDVVEAAGASHGSFYRYFDSKEDLFRVIATDAASELVACIEAFPADHAAEPLREWLDSWFGVYAQHGGIIALWRDTRFSDPVLDDLTRRVADAALGRLLAVLEKQAVGDPLVNAIAFLGLIEAVPHHVHAFGYFRQPAAVGALVAIIRRGFFGLDVG